MITVVDIAGMAPVREGHADITRFLNGGTVGAQRVEGMAYRLAPGGKAGPFLEAAAYQLFYVTEGRLEAEYGGSRHPLARGRGVYCGPGETCAFTNAGSGPAAFYRFLVPA